MAKKPWFLPLTSTPAEALADAWASIDGKVEKFRKGKTAKSIMSYGGYYAGYMEDAEELISRLHARGFNVTKLHNHQRAKQVSK